jgi:hypothetical protein
MVSGFLLSKQGMLWFKYSGFLTLFFALAYYLTEHYLLVNDHMLNSKPKKTLLEDLFFSLIIQSTIGMNLDGFDFKEFIYPSSGPTLLTFLTLCQMFSVLYCASLFI